MKDWRSISSERAGHGRVRVQPPHPALHAQQPGEGPAVLLAEVGVARERLLARLAALEDEAQLAPAGQAEVERRADALGRGRQAVPGAVADEEDAVLDRRAHLVGDPVALVAHGRDVEVAGQAHGRLLDVVARLEGADADAQLVARGEAPRVAGAHVGGIEPQLEVVAGGVRVDLQPAREARLRAAGSACGALESTRRQPRASTISGAVRSPRSVCRVNPGPAVDLGRVELDVGRLRAQQARTARGSRRSRTSTAGSSGRSSSACG